MLSSAEQRFIEEVKKLEYRISKNRLTDANKIERVLGKIQARHTKVQRYYDMYPEQSETSTRFQLI